MTKKRADYYPLLYAIVVVIWLFVFRSVTKAISNLKEWKEVARWIKFEETVESEGNRWSKPHVSTPSLAGWMQLRKFFRSGLILLDVEARDMGKICDIVAAALASTSEGIDAIHETFLQRYQCTNIIIIRNIRIVLYLASIILIFQGPIPKLWLG